MICHGWKQHHDGSIEIAALKLPDTGERLQDRVERLEDQVSYLRALLAHADARIAALEGDAD